MSPLAPCVEAARPGELLSPRVGAGLMRTSKLEAASAACLHRVMKQGRCELRSQDQEVVSAACRRRHECAARTDRTQAVS
jgi:hypothetical protein